MRWVDSRCVLCCSLLLRCLPKLRDGNLSFQQCDHQAAVEEEEATISYTLFTLAFRQEPDQLVLAFFAQGEDRGKCWIKGTICILARKFKFILRTLLGALKLVIISQRSCTAWRYLAIPAESDVNRRYPTLSDAIRRFPTLSNTIQRHIYEVKLAI